MLRCNFFIDIVLTNACITYLTMHPQLKKQKGPRWRFYKSFADLMLNPSTPWHNYTYDSAIGLSRSNPSQAEFLATLGKYRIPTPYDGISSVNMAYITGITLEYLPAIVSITTGPRQEFLNNFEHSVDWGLRTSQLSEYERRGRKECHAVAGLNHAIRLCHNKYNHQSTDPENEVFWWYDPTYWVWCRHDANASCWDNLHSCHPPKGFLQSTAVSLQDRKPKFDHVLHTMDAYWTRVRVLNNDRHRTQRITTGYNKR
jgi:hypothetical protein